MTERGKPTSVSPSFPDIPTVPDIPDISRKLQNKGTQEKRPVGMSLPVNRAGQRRVRNGLEWGKDQQNHFQFTFAI